MSLYEKKTNGDQTFFKKTHHISKTSQVSQHIKLPCTIFWLTTFSYKYLLLS